MLQKCSWSSNPFYRQKCTLRKGDQCADREVITRGFSAALVLITNARKSLEGLPTRAWYELSTNPCDGNKVETGEDVVRGQPVWNTRAVFLADRKFHRSRWQHCDKARGETSSAVPATSDRSQQEAQPEPRGGDGKPTLTAAGTLCRWWGPCRRGRASDGHQIPARAKTEDCHTDEQPRCTHPVSCTALCWSFRACEGPHPALSSHPTASHGCAPCHLGVLLQEHWVPESPGSQ